MQRLIELEDGGVDAGVRLESPGDEFDGVDRHMNEVSEGNQRGANHPLNRFRRRQDLLQAERLQITINVDRAAGTVNDQLVLHRTRVPRNVHAAEAALRFDCTFAMKPLNSAIAFVTRDTIVATVP